MAYHSIFIPYANSISIGNTCQLPLHQGTYHSAIVRVSCCVRVCLRTCPCSLELERAPDSNTNPFWGLGRMWCVKNRVPHTARGGAAFYFTYCVTTPFVSIAKWLMNWARVRGLSPITYLKYVSLRWRCCDTNKSGQYKEDVFFTTCYFAKLRLPHFLPEIQKIHFYYDLLLASLAQTSQSTRDIWYISCFFITRFNVCVHRYRTSSKYSTTQIIKRYFKTKPQADIKYFFY